MIFHHREKNLLSDLTSFLIYGNVVYIMKIQRTPEFKEWFDIQTEKSKAQRDARLKNIYNYFGNHKSLGQKLLELRWKNGRRVYYTLITDEDITVILLGGFKNVQKKNIKETRQILKRETLKTGL